MTTAEEHEWLVRFCIRNETFFKNLFRQIKIILKEIKGIGEKSVFNAFHPDAYDLWNQCCNLSKVCQDLHDPNIRLQQKNEVQLMVPFKPMLGQRETDLTKVFLQKLFIYATENMSTDPQIFQRCSVLH